MGGRTLARISDQARLADERCRAACQALTSPGGSKRPLAPSCTASLRAPTRERPPYSGGKAHE